MNTNRSYIHTFKVTEKGTPGSCGLNPYSGLYEQIQFEGDLSFQSLFDFTIDFDTETKSLNLFESLKKIIQRGV